MIGRKDYHERKEEKIERYKEMADRSKERSQGLCDRASEKMNSIPFGQPILVGHYSENRDRNFRNSIDRDFGKMNSEMNKANYYEEKAEIMKNNTAISSDNPDAIKLLEEKIATLKEKQKTYKDMNKYYRKNKTLVGFEKLTDEEAKELDKKIEEDPFFNGKPVASWELSNLNAQIKNTEKRIEKLKETDAMADETFDFDLGYIHSNEETNRIEIYFDEKPGEELRKRLKINGFKWSPRAKAWQRLRNERALRIAKNILEVEE